MESTYASESKLDEPSRIFSYRKNSLQLYAEEWTVPTFLIAPFILFSFGLGVANLVTLFLFISPSERASCRDITSYVLTQGCLHIGVAFGALLTIAACGTPDNQKYDRSGEEESSSFWVSCGSLLWIPALIAVIISFVHSILITDEYFLQTRETCPGLLGQMVIVNVVAVLGVELMGAFLVTCILAIWVKCRHRQNQIQRRVDEQEAEVTSAQETERLLKKGNELLSKLNVDNLHLAHRLNLQKGKLLKFIHLWTVNRKTIKILKFNSSFGIYHLLVFNTIYFDR